MYVLFKSLIDSLDEVHENLVDDFLHSQHLFLTKDMAHDPPLS